MFTRHFLIAMPVVALLGAFSAPFQHPDPGATPIRAERVHLTGRVNHVRDGDTIVVAGVPVRLAALDCPERSEAGGSQATAMMKRLVAGTSVDCELTGARSYDRVVGYCSAKGTDLGAQLIAAHVCTIYQKFNTEGRY